MYKIFSYFVQPKSYDGTVAAEETNMDGDSGKLIMAVNGWVMGDDPLRNFADPGRFFLTFLKSLYLHAKLFVHSVGVWHVPD